MSQPNQNGPQAAQNGARGGAENGRANAPQGEDLKTTISKIEDNLHRYLKQAFVLANLYYFFQGAILTAVSQVSSPKCKQWYFFSVLSLLPLVLNGFPLVYVLYKCAKTKNEQDKYTLLGERERLRGDSTETEQREEPQAAQTDEYWKRIRYMGVGIAALTLLVLNGVMLYGCHSLLCENEGSANVSYDGDCFRVCNDRSKCLKICTE